MILLAGFYQDKDAHRQAEFLECIRRNAANERIAALHLFVEYAVDQPALAREYPVLSGEKIHLVPHGRRVRYADLFAYANDHFGGRRVIIANADIYFDETLAGLDRLDLSGRLLCLSRWDVQPDGAATFFDHGGSQDAWIFDAPIPRFRSDFHLGLLGCDNRLAWEAANAGLELHNPGRHIRALHLHLSGVRRYTQQERLAGPTRGVPPDEGLLLDVPTRPASVRTAAAAVSPEARRRGSIVALTSLSPSEQSLGRTRQAVASWRRAGLEVVAFNHPSEIPRLTQLYDVAFVPVVETADAVFGRHYIPIVTMLDWAATHNVPALLINADIELRAADWELKRLRWLADDGLCYIVRHNYNQDARHATREPHGIDAFLFHGRHVHGLPPSFLSMGQPFWDYWLPHSFVTRGLPIYSVDFPLAFHQSHPNRWSWESWRRCSLEFIRITGETIHDTSYPSCHAMSTRVRQHFDRHRTPMTQHTTQIRQWVQQTFSHPKPKVFIELGAHCGEDTAWLAQLPNVTLHAFEPDPRNRFAAPTNVEIHRQAVGAYTGPGQLTLSEVGWGQEWTYSSSLLKPKNHVYRYPVTFGRTVKVDVTTLDAFTESAGIDRVDFIWADIQGAEGDMIRGGQKTLARTRYLYTEYSDDELYEGQATLRQIMDLLPAYKVIELWPEDVLLVNTALDNTG